MTNVQQKQHNQQKIEMWKKELIKLEKELEEISRRKGEAAKDGDLRENAAYQMAVEDAETWRARISTIKKIIADLQKEP